MIKASNYIKALALGAALSCGAGHAAAQLSATATVDSLELTMGSKGHLRIEIVKPAGEGRLAGAPEVGSQFGAVDIVDLSVDSVQMADKRTQLIYNYTFQAFEPGKQQLPALTYYGIVDGKIDSTKTSPIELKVFAVDVDSLATINPNAAVASIRKRMVDYIPDAIASYWWAWLLGALLIGGGLTLWWLIAKKGKLKKVAAVFVKPPETPFERAIRRLNEIRDQRLALSGNDKHYFTELTDVLRIYLYGRYGIYAMEMTTPQIIAAMKADADANRFVDLIDPVLQLADAVKFAKFSTTPDENTLAYRDVRRMVENSRPIQTAPAGASQSGQGASQSGQGTSQSGQGIPPVTTQPAAADNTKQAQR